MTEIKSALEIALERTEGIKGDKKTITATERRNDGKRLASRYLNPTENEKTDPAGEIKHYPKDEQSFVREGFLKTILANLSLPTEGTYKESLKRLESGLQQVTKERRQISYLFQQVDQFFEQYLATRSQVEEQLKQQYAPKLREKEQALASQLGSTIKLTPESDPEFMNILSKNLARLEEQYNQALDQVKEEIEKLGGGSS